VGGASGTAPRPGASVTGVTTLPRQLNTGALEFLRERHLATLTSIRPDGSPHVVPVGFTWEPGRNVARVITDGSSAKARIAAAGGRVALCQVDGRRWLTLEGTSTVSDDRTRVADAVDRYAERYRVPRENPTRVVIEIAVTRVLASPGLLDAP
jgi:F420H(2)-dependent biliverdin reductase